jgi:nitroimidazol reductase NimA-like FMN-containing flavoprotein (pyridoxamine 5'-phosphate oxidase superfamily)
LGAILTDDSLKVRRIPELEVTDRKVLHQVLDACKIVHIGFIHDERPVVIPLAFVRDGERILLHGSTGSRLFRSLASGAQLCATVTHLDGIVAARSAFHSSMNYRSVMIFGIAQEVNGDDKESALERFTNNLMPGRWQEVRAMTKKEKSATMVLAISLEKMSGKIRTGGPSGEDEEDLTMPIWAGQIPITTTFAKPIPADDLIPGIEIPDSVSKMR